MQSAKILIVEDEALVALDLSHQLHDLGYQVCGTADNGLDAIALAGLHRPDLVLMDIVLKGEMDGVTAAQHIGNGGQIPVIFLTAYSDKATVERAAQSAPYGYLTKPFQPRELQAAIEIALYKAAAMRQLRDSERWFAATLRCVGDGVVATDAADRIQFINPIAEALLGWRQADALGKPASEVLRLNDRHTGRAIESPSSRALRANAAVDPELGILATAHNGRQLPIDASAAPIRDERGNLLGVVVAFREVSERLSAEQALSQLAHVDPLTGLANRGKLLLQAEHELLAAKRHQTRLGLIFMDLDRFKQVNDQFGHAAGDLLLQTVAKRLQTCIRKTDCVARLGGDEFVLLLPDLHSADELALIADKIIASVLKPFDLGQHAAAVGISLGAALYPEDAQSVDTLMQCADAALYQAKTDGRGVLRFYRPEWTARAQARQQLDQQLRRALATHELELNYQPLLALADGHLIGAEALLRWHHPDGRLLPAGDFLPQTAQTPLMTELDDWVLEEACREAAAWPSPNGHAPTLAINISTREFSSGDLVDKLRRILAATGLAPRQLCLELTEPTLLAGGEAALLTVDALKALGVEIAIDDFGAGTASLNLLRRLQPHKLKIDHTLIEPLPEAPTTPSMVAAIIAMAHHLGIQVIAEGVETSGQSTTLMDEGCDSAQGYWYAAPCSAADFRHYLSSYGAAPQ